MSPKTVARYIIYPETTPQFEQDIKDNEIVCTTARFAKFYFVLSGHIRLKILTPEGLFFAF